MKDIGMMSKCVALAENPLKFVKPFTFYISHLIIYYLSLVYLLFLYLLNIFLLAISWHTLYINKIFSLYLFQHGFQVTILSSFACILDQMVGMIKTK